MPQQDPLENYRFRVEIDGIALAAFSEVAIGATVTQVIEYRDLTRAARTSRALW